MSNFLSRRAAQLGKSAADLQMAVRQVADDVRIVRQNRGLILGLLTGRAPPQPAGMRGTYRAREIGAVLALMFLSVLGPWWWEAGHPVAALWMCGWIGVPAALLAYVNDRMAAACEEDACND